nr:ribonuclease H-like domain-containing protein [Tanacetum cinerariifolium]
MVAATKPSTIKKVVQIANILTDEALRNGSIKKNHEKKGNRGEPSKDKNVRDDNKSTRTGNDFATTTNPVGRENMGTVPKCTTCNTYHSHEAPCRTYFNYNRTCHFAKDCRVVPRNVNPINARNPTVKAYYECGSTDHINLSYPRSIHWDQQVVSEPMVKLCKEDTICDYLFLSDKIETGSTTTTTLTEKIHILNLGEYDLWLIRIEQYFLMTDYSPWKVIKNCNKVLKITIGTVEQIYEPTSVEEKLDRKNEMKAGGTLLTALLNKGQLKFHSYQDAKLLMEAIEKKYRGNNESKKVQRRLLKQQYHNLAVSSSETFDKLLIGSSSTSQNLQNMAFVSSNSANNTSSINEADNTTYGVSTALTQGNTVNFTFIDNLSDVVIYAFLASQHNSPQLPREDLEQINPDDLEEMDLHWEMAMLTITTRRFIKRTCRNLDINGQKIGFDRSKVECFNYHKNGHFVREYGIGWYDWSYQAEEEHHTNYALMALTSSGNSSSSDSENQENVKSRSDKGYHAFPPPYTGNYIPPKPDLTFTDEQVESDYVDVVSNVTYSNDKTVESKHEFVDVKNKGVYNTIETKSVRKNNFSPPIIEDWNSNDESVVEFEPKVEVKIFRPSIEMIKFVNIAKKKVEKKTKKGVINSGCFRHMTGNKCYLTDYENYDGGFVSFRDGKGRISGKGIENQLDCKVIRSHNETEFKNSVMNQFCDMKGIKKKFNVARTPQQNSIAERKNRILIEAARTMALVIKPHNKTPYELIRGRPPLIDFMKPFGCLVTILNTRDHLGKFDGKADEGFFVSPKDSAIDTGKKATEVDESRVSGNGGQDDQVTRSEFEGLLQQERQTEHINSTNTFNSIVLLVNTARPSFANTASPSQINAARTPASTNAFEEHPFKGFSPFKNAFSLPHVPIVTPINDTGIFSNAYDDEAVEEEVDMNNVVSYYTILDAPLTKFLKDHPKDQVISGIETHVQIRQMTKINEEHGLISLVQKC